MKKTGNSSAVNKQVRRSSGPRSSAPVRSGAPKASNTNQPLPYSTTPRKKRRKKKSSSGAKAAAIVLAVIAVGVIVTGGLYFAGIIDFEKKIEVTEPDGKVIKVKAEDAFAELKTDKFFQGIFIDDIDVSGMTKEQAKQAVDAAHQDKKLDTDIKLNVSGTAYKVDLSSIGLSYNTDEIVNEAYNLYRPENAEDTEKLAQLYDSVRKLKANPKKYNTSYTMSTDNVSSLVSGILTPMQVEVADAKMKGYNTETGDFDISTEVVGRSFDINKASDDVKNLLDNGTYEGTVDVAVTETQPQVTAESIRADFGQISSQSSNETSGRSGRITNITVACKKINGTVLNPGEQFSFNGVVGRRTEANGFKVAPVIKGNKHDEDYGGGICQVSSMLYNAVVKADLQVDRRSPHKWVSGYIPAGRDATVDYGVLDFCFTNNSGYPIVIKASCVNRVVTCAILGHHLPDGKTIKFESKVVSTKAHGPTKYVAVNQKIGYREQVSEAHNGTTAVSYRVTYDANGKEIERKKESDSVYKVTDQVIEVGVLKEDGTKATLDTKTGKITDGDLTPTPDPSASDATDENGETKKTKETKESKEKKESKETKESKESKESKETKAPKETKETTAETTAETQAPETTAEQTTEAPPPETTPEETQAPADQGEAQ